MALPIGVNCGDLTMEVSDPAESEPGSVALSFQLFKQKDEQVQEENDVLFQCQWTSVDSQAMLS